MLRGARRIYPHLHAVLLVFVLLPFIASAKEKAPDWLIALTALKPLQPGSADPAVILLDENLLDVSPDGVFTTRTRWAVRLASREGRKYSHGCVSYDQSAEKVKAFEAWTIRANGEVVAYGKKDVVDGASYSNALELYGNSRRQLIDAAGDAGPDTVFGFESIVEDRSIYSQRVWSFQSYLPVECSRYTVNLPTGWEWKTQTFNIDGLAPEVSGRSTTWTMNRLLASKNEPLGPGAGEYLPWMSIDLHAPLTRKIDGTRPVFDTWHDVAAYFVGKYEIAAQPDLALKAKALALTEKRPTSWQRIQALCRLAQQVNYISINLDNAHGGGLFPRAASQVLRCNYGDCKDKSTLLRALLGSVGIISYPVVLYSGDRDRVRENWASPLQFNHCIVAIQVDQSVTSPAVATHPTFGRVLFFDPTDDCTPPGHLPAADAGASGLILDDRTEQLFRLPATETAQNHCERSIIAKLSSDGRVSGRIQEIFTEQDSATARSEYRAQSPSGFQRQIERWLAKTLPTPRTHDIVAEDAFDDARFTLSFRFDAGDNGKRMQDRLLVFKPVMVARRDGTALLKGTRSQPVVLSDHSFSERSKIDLPEGFRVDETISPVDLQTAFGRYRAKVTEERGKIVFERSLELSSARIPAADYETVRVFFEKILQSEQTPVVLARF